MCKQHNFDFISMFAISIINIWLWWNWIIFFASLSSEIFATIKHQKSFSLQLKKGNSSSSRSSGCSVEFTSFHEYLLQLGMEIEICTKKSMKHENAIEKF